MVIIWDTLITDTFFKPDSRGRIRTLPGAKASAVFVVNASTIIVFILLALNSFV